MMGSRLNAPAVLELLRAIEERAVVYGDIVGKADIAFGRWDSGSRSVKSDGKSVNAVRVTARLSKDDGTGMTTLFAGIVGEEMIDISASAAAGKFGVACLIALNPDGKGLKLDKDAELELEGCGAQSNATSKESLNVKGDVIATLTAKAGPSARRWIMSRGPPKCRVHAPS